MDFLNTLINPKQNPFSVKPAGINTAFSPVKPVAPEAQSAFIGASNPFTQAAFAGIPKDATKNGLSFLQTAPGEKGLGDRAINGTLGRNLFWSA